MTRKLIALSLSTLAVLALAAADCPPGSICYRHVAPQAPLPPGVPAGVVRPVYRQPIAQQGMAADPIAAVNSERARRGLRPLASDAGLASVAATNNAMQARRGMGHHYLGGAAQCSATGHAPVAQWMASAPHRAILMSPTATRIGLAIGGGYSTASVR